MAASEGCKNYKWCSLILAKVLHIYNLIENKLHQRHSPYNFTIFSQFLDKIWAGWGIELLGYVLSL